MSIASRFVLMQCCMQIIYLRFAFFSFNTKLFFSLRFHGAQSLSFLFATFFGFRISRALVNPEKWAAQSCQTAKRLNLVFNPPRKRNHWVTELVKTFLNSQKIARDALLKLLSNRRLKTVKRKKRTQKFENQNNLKKRGCWFLPICIQRLR